MAQLEHQRDASSAGGNWFTTTHWSVVLAAGQTSSPTAQPALEQLCRTYWYPLYAYVRRRGFTPHDAQDLTQGFFAQLLSRDFLDGVAAEKGKFRSFLLVSLNNFLSNERDRALAAKRGGGREFLSLEQASAEERYQFEPASNVTAADLYDRRWAWTVLEQALNQLCMEFVAAGKEEHFNHLKIFLEREAAAGDYAKVALEMKTTSAAVAMAVCRLRQRYRELVRAEIANTLANPSDTEEEIRYLFTVIGVQGREP